jgi:TPP-dependent trihydroxycyclohexane-1,2-dione (THcHDO) dehydratase
LRNIVTQHNTIRLTMAQALARFLTMQMTVIDDQTVRSLAASLPFSAMAMSPG